MTAQATLLAVSTVELTIRMVVGLIVVGLLLLVLNRATRLLIDGRGRTRPAISIRHQQRLDRHASVTLLTAGGRNLLVGTTSQSIVLLAEGDDLGVSAGTAAPSTPASSKAQALSNPPGMPGLSASAGAGGAGTGDGLRAGKDSDGGAADGSAIDVRERGRRGPIRLLQNKTVRRG